MLAMKQHCEKCGANLTATATAYICSYECTFCQRCSEAMLHICPNCSGQLQRRPARKMQTAETAAEQAQKKLAAVLQREG